MSGPLPSTDATAPYWRHELTDKLRDADALISEFVKYRTAIAVMLQTGEFMPVLEQADMDDIREIVSSLYSSIDLSLLEAFLNAP